MKVLGDKGIIGKIAMLATHAIDLGHLTGTQRFVGIETPDAFQQTLAAQDLVAAGDAPSEIVRAVEEGAVAIGHATVKRKHVAVDGPIRGRFLAALENRDRSAGPDRPVPKQPAAKPDHDALSRSLHHKRREEVEYDVIIVAGIERDALLGACCHKTTHDIERGVAVEWSDLDGDDVVDRREPGPESAAKRDAAHGRL